MRKNFIIFDTPPFVDLVNLLVSNVNGRSDLRLVATTLASMATL